MLEIKQVVKHYNDKKAVDGISFTVKKGNIFGLLGPNGAGKSTLLRMITGITYPDSGEIRLNGEIFDPLKHSLHIGYMPEERGLYKKMKAGEQALYLAQLKGMQTAEAKKSINHWFKSLHMESWFNKRVEDLSKGMSQKLQFVTTVLHNPQLLILDEPFSGLDPVNSNTIKDKIYELAAQGTTIIFSTHRMEQVEEICDEIVLVNQGKNILEGSVADIKNRYKNNQYQLNINSADLVSNTVFDVINTTNTGEYVIKTHANYKPNDALSYCITKGYTIQTFKEILPSLNDIFIGLTAETAVSQFEK